MAKHEALVATEPASQPIELQPQNNAVADDLEGGATHHFNATSVIEPLAVRGPTALKLISAIFCFLNCGINDGSLGALIPYILKHYTISTAWMAIPYGVAFSGWFFAAMLGGYIRITIGTGGIIIAGALLQLLAQLLRFWIPPFGLFFFTFFVVALGQGLQEPQANTFVTTLKSAHRWLGVLHGCYAVGSLVGPLMASAIASNLQGQWAAFYYVPIVIGAVNLALCSYAFRDEVALHRSNEASADNRRSRTALVELKATVKQKNVWLISLFFFLYLGAAITAGGWVVEFLVEVREGRLAQVGYISAAFSGGMAAGRFLLAEPIHRFGEKRMVLVCAVLSVAFQIIFWLVPNIVVNAVAVSLLGFLLGPFFATAVFVGSKTIPQELQQSGLAFIFVIAQAGGAIFPAITGIISAQAGVSTLQPMLVGLLAAMTAAWLVVPNPKGTTLL